MTSQIRRILEMVLRVLVFLRAHLSDDPAYVANVARLEASAAKLQALAAQEQSGHIEVNAAVVTKDELEASLQDGLTLLSRLAVTATRDDPAMPVRLTIPKPHSTQQALITGARAVVTEAKAQQDKLTKFGMTPGYLDQLAATVDQYEQAIGAKGSGKSAHVGANAEMHDVAVEIVSLVRLLDAIQRPGFRHDPEKRAAWKSARTILRRTPKPQAEPVQPPTDPTPPPAGNQKTSAA
jgi:hypothetical protein